MRVVQFTEKEFTAAFDKCRAKMKLICAEAKLNEDQMEQTKIGQALRGMTIALNWMESELRDK